MPTAIQNATQIGATSGIVTSAGTLLPDNPYRVTLVIQNLGTHPLFVKLGAGASTSDFTFILSGGSGNDDGLGAIFAEDTVSYTGIITIAGTSPRCVGTDL